MSVRRLTTSAVLAAATALGVWTAVGHDAPQAATATPAGRLTASGTAPSGTLAPGGALTGTLVLSNPRTAAVEVSDVVLAAPTAPGCAASGVVLAPTLPPTPQSPLAVPGRGATTLEWTAYMDGNGDHACQGATLTSTVTVDGTRAGTVRLPVGRLARPAAPTGGRATSTRAALTWRASAAATPAYVLERAPVGTDAWVPACDSSPERPLWTPSCTDTGLTPGTSYRYRLTVRTGHWRATSLPSGPVTTKPA